MLETISHFNPFVDKYAIRDFHKLETWQKVTTFALTAIAPVIIMALGRKGGRAVTWASFPVAVLTAVATFRILVALFVKYLADGPTKAPKVSSSPPPIAGPSSPILPPQPAKERTSAEIKKERCKERIQRELGPKDVMGTAVDNGDCFYDALVQLLNKKGHSVSVESLRSDIKIALGDPKWKTHLYSEFNNDKRGLGTFDDYCFKVGYSQSMLQENEAPLWGHPSREGVILCEKYRFKLRILKAGPIDSEIEGDEELKRLRSVRDNVLKDCIEGSNEYQKFSQKYESQIQERYRILYDNSKMYYLEEEIVSKNADYEQVLTLALFSDHFIPLFIS